MSLLAFRLGRSRPRLDDAPFVFLLVEGLLNVEKNGGFGLEHAFCANITAAHNLHVFMQVAYVLGQLLVNGMLRRLTRACRKVSDVKLIEMLRSSLAFVPIPPDIPPVGQLRFQNSS